MIRCIRDIDFCVYDASPPVGGKLESFCIRGQMTFDIKGECCSRVEAFVDFGAELAA